MGNRNDKPSSRDEAASSLASEQTTPSIGTDQAQIQQTTGTSGAVAKRRKSSRRRKSKHKSNSGSSSGSNSGSNSTTTNSGNDDDADERTPKLSYWQMIRGGYDELVNAIIRPPRAEYELEVLGPSTFSVEGRIFIREDLELVNKRGLKLQCSHWKPRDSAPEEKMPCMVYLHGNASCRAEALECLPLILSSGLTLFSLDFAGSGQSEGEYISLGWYERDDVESVVDYLRQTGQVSTIGLWGRSMGAVTALMFGNSDPTIACMVLDSPFASLKQLAKELVDHAQLSVPKFALGIALKFVRSSVKSRAGFDINKLEPIKNADKCFIPALFGAAEGDVFIRPHHSEQIHEQYAGDKNLITFDGDHNTPRPQFFNSSVGIFLHNTMIIPCLGDDAGVRQEVDESDVYANFHNAYSIPAPLSQSGAGIGIDVGVPGAEQSASGTGARGDLAMNIDDDFYEEAMLRHAIELSIAEAEAAGSTDEAQIFRDIGVAELHQADGEDLAIPPIDSPPPLPPGSMELPVEAPKVNTEGYRMSKDLFREAGSSDLLGEADFDEDGDDDLFQVVHDDTETNGTGGGFSVPVGDIGQELNVKSDDIVVDVKESVVEKEVNVPLDDVVEDMNTIVEQEEVNIGVAEDVKVSGSQDSGNATQGNANEDTISKTTSPSKIRPPAPTKPRPPAPTK